MILLLSVAPKLVDPSLIMLVSGLGWDVWGRLLAGHVRRGV